jgi:putative membrane protein
MIIIIIGMIILPSLYAWVNILASLDPYSSTGNIKVAVANLDEGGTLFDQSIDIGSSVTEELKNNDQMGWTFYDTREEAIQSVIQADSYAAIIIPENFSADICQMFTDPIQPNLEYYVNMKTNAIAPKMTTVAAETLQGSIKEQIISTVVTTLYDELNIVGDDLNQNSDKIREALDKLYDSEDIIVEIPDKVTGIRDKAQSALDELESKEEKLEKLRELVTAAQNLISDLSTDLTTLDEKLTEYEPRILQALQDVGAIADDINDITNHFLDIHNKIHSILDHFQILSTLLSNLEEALLNGNTISSILSEISTTSGEIYDLTKDLKNDLQEELFPKIHKYLDASYDLSLDAIEATEQGLEEIDATITLIDKVENKGQEALGYVDSFLTDYPKYQSEIINVIDKVKKLDENINIETVIQLLMANSQQEGNFFANPVGIKEKDFYPTETYGAAMTPFYTTLCLWVGAVILCAILTTEAKNARFPFTRRQEYFGKWLLFVSLAILQGLIVALGDLFLLKITILHPVIFTLTTIFLSIVFVTIVYTLVFQFGNVGKAMAVILLVLQIAGSGGTFPIECTPEFFQKIYAVLPFTYGINAMRETVAGIYYPNFIYDFKILGIYLFSFLAFGLISKHWIKKITIGAQKKMSESGLTE